MAVAAAALSALAVLVTAPRGRRRLAGERAHGGQVPLVAAGAGVVAIGAALTWSAVAVAAGVAVLTVVSGVRRGRRRRRLASAEVVGFAYAVAAELRAGRLPPEALAAAAADLLVLRPGLCTAARAAELGADLAAELRIAAVDTACPRLATIADVWAATAATGAPQAGVLERVAAGWEADDSLVDELDAALAGPRASVLVLALLPAAGVLLGRGLGRGSWHVLVATRPGHLLLVAAAALHGVGTWWMRRIVRRAAR